MSTVWQFFVLGVGLSPVYVLAAPGMVLVYRASRVVNFVPRAPCNDGNPVLTISGDRMEVKEANG